MCHGKVVAVFAYRRLHQASVLATTVFGFVYAIPPRLLYCRTFELQGWAGFEPRSLACLCSENIYLYSIIQIGMVPPLFELVICHMSRISERAQTVEKGGGGNMPGPALREIIRRGVRNRNGRVYDTVHGDTAGTLGIAKVSRPHPMSIGGPYTRIEAFLTCCLGHVLGVMGLSDPPFICLCVSILSEG